MTVASALGLGSKKVCESDITTLETSMNCVEVFCLTIHLRHLKKILVTSQFLERPRGEKHTAKERTAELLARIPDLAQSDVDFETWPLLAIHVKLP